jgi:sarcosine oxidase/L-pipecolate oxidase
MISIDSKIAIVGAGVFGLSTALHLAKKGAKNLRRTNGTELTKWLGYRNVTVFDYQPYDINEYNPNKGLANVYPLHVKSG